MMLSIELSYVDLTLVAIRCHGLCVARVAVDSIAGIAALSGW